MNQISGGVTGYINNDNMISEPVRQYDIDGNFIKE